MFKILSDINQNDIIIQIANNEGHWEKSYSSGRKIGNKYFKGWLAIMDKFQIKKNITTKIFSWEQLFKINEK